jgi:4-hydroxy-2-oxoheptanedioate aldolase
MTVELLGLAGFDFVIIDAEHSPTSIETSQHMVRAADSVGVTPITRIGVNIRQHILRYLEVGALGVQVPMVTTKEEAKNVVDAVKYPPVGKRGASPMRAADYGLKMPFIEYVKESNKQTLVVTQVETQEAADNIDEVLTVDGIDVFFIGAMDLSNSLGKPGQFDNPELKDIIAKLCNKIKAAGKTIGMPAIDIPSTKEALDLGVRYFTHGSSFLMVKSAKEYLAEARAL